MLSECQLHYSLPSGEHGVQCSLGYFASEQAKPMVALEAVWMHREKGLCPGFLQVPELSFTPTVHTQWQSKSQRSLQFERQSCFMSQDFRRKLKLVPTVLIRENTGPNPLITYYGKLWVKLMDNGFLSQLWEINTFLQQDLGHIPHLEREQHLCIRRGSRVGPVVRRMDS